jgi:hypothetical protein
MTITLAPDITPTVADTIDPITIVLGTDLQIHLTIEQAQILADALDAYLDQALSTYALTPKGLAALGTH